MTQAVGLCLCNWYCRVCGDE